MHQPPRQRKDWQGHYVTLLAPVETTKGKRLTIDARCKVHGYDLATGTFTLLHQFGEELVRITGIQPHLIQYSGVAG